MTNGITHSLVAASALLTLAACGGSGTATTVAVPTVPCGVSPLGTVSVRRFCGTGSVSLHRGSTTTALTQAECTFADGGVTVNGGVLVLGHASGPAGQLTYIGVDANPAPAAPGGTPTASYRGLVSADLRGRVISVTDASVDLAGTRTSGTAQGTATDGGRVTVTFSC